MKVRRIVTGHTPDGKATVASDTNVDAITLGMLPGTEFYRLWGADEALTFPDDGSSRPAPAYFPPSSTCSRVRSGSSWTMGWRFI